MSDHPRPYDPEDPPRYGEWVWVGGLGASATPAARKGVPKIWIAILVTLALVAWAVMAFRGCERTAPSGAELVFGAKSLGDDGVLRGRLVIDVPDGKFIDAGLDGDELGANLVLSAKIGANVMEVVPAQKKYIQPEVTREVDGRVLLGGKVNVSVALRGAKEFLPNDVTVSFKTTLVDRDGDAQDELSGTDTVRFED